MRAQAYIQCMSRAFIDDKPLDPRARQLLRTLIGRHIHDGEPVGSQTLARHAGLDVSPATIRNILADLEDAGLLSSPHTSAGRVPTPQGYRVFVDSLLQLRPLPEAELARLRHELPAGSGTQSLLANASELLSAMSHFVGVVSVPRREQFAFRQIDFVPLDAQRVLAILVFADNDVQNRIIQTRRAYDASELERVANYLNHNFAGCPLSDIRSALVRELKVARSEMETLLAHTVELAEQAMAGVGESTHSEGMLLAGQTRLMGVQDLSDLDRLRELFEAFARKREILQLLERTLCAPGMRIFIGEETGLAPLEGMSLITAPYRAGGTADGQVLGVLGVIGPTRMAYERVIPVVQAAADILGAALDAP
jgi:heat-inducible transcriptional repressor